MPSITTLFSLVRAALLAAMLASAGFTHAAATATETLNRIETLTGLKGTYIESEGVFKVTQPRTDVAVRVDRWPLQPFVGLSTWVAFARGGRTDTMLMGDLVVFEDEINPVMSVLLEGGVAVTALHNHFLYDDPKVYFMHIGGEGTVESLAPTIHGALATIAAIRAERPRPALDSGIEPPPSVSSISGDRISAVLRTQGQAKDGMYKIVIGREVTMECGCPAGKEMGVNTWAGFAGTDDDALVDGDFAVRESELQAVLKALRGGGINIVSIHHHMVGETPRTLFLHYWGRGHAEALAGTLRAALDAQGLP